MKMILRRPMPNNQTYQVAWPDGWPVPSVGDNIELIDGAYEVRSVNWYPLGEDGTSEDPFVYLTLN